MSNTHIVLDTSSVLAYVHGSVSIGEVLSEVAENGGRVGIPFACLTAAEYAITSIDTMVVLQLLTRHPVVDLLWPAPEDFFDPVALRRAAGGSLLDGTVAHFATARDADVLTGQRARYADLLPADQVLSIDLDA